MSSRINEPLTSLSVRKSNDFISAKYKSSLLENQVMAIALSRIEVNATDRDCTLEARLYPGELKRLVSDESHIYRDLKKLAKTITGHTMFLEDGRGNFKAFSVVPNADYIDGVFIIKFNNELRDHVLGLEKNYTNLELSVMTDFKKNASFRLYEVLKKEAYKIPKGENKYVEVEYNISELRFIIGLANSDDQSVKNAMANMGNNVDWDMLYDKLDKKDKKYEEWRDFQRRVLKPAQDELEEKSDIRFEYEGLKEKRKTRRIRFTIFRNTPKNPEIIDEKKQILDMKSKKNRQMEIPYDINRDFYDEFVGHNKLTKEDIDLLIMKSSGDTDRVREVIILADQQKNINNYMGWLISAIENDYVQTTTVSGNAKKADEIKAVMEDYSKNRESAARAVWNKVKTKEDFNEFLGDLSLIGLDINQLEIIYSVVELTQAYTDWKLGNGINL